MAVDRPLPVPDAATGPYWEAARGERLVIPRCDDCGKFHFYPRTLCPQCSSPRLQWTQVSGAGEVYSFTVIYRAPSPAFATAVPYVVAA
ncbi:MAG: zinc ribbon domain-containing protein, partial [Betaproteobacteria bacterium]